MIVWGCAMCPPGRGFGSALAAMRLPGDAAEFVWPCFLLETRRAQTEIAASAYLR